MENRTEEWNYKEYDITDSTVRIAMGDNMTSKSFKQLGEWLEKNKNNKEHLFVNKQVSMRFYGNKPKILMGCRSVFDLDALENRDKQPEWY